MDLLTLLQCAVQQHASDLHLVTNSVPRLRINGQLQKMALTDLSHHHMTSLLQSLLTEQQQQTFSAQKELDCAITIKDLGRFRVNLSQQLHGSSAVFRYIPTHIASVAELQLPPLLTELITPPHGNCNSATLAIWVGI